MFHFKISDIINVISDIPNHNCKQQQQKEIRANASNNCVSPIVYFICSQKI